MKHSELLSDSGMDLETRLLCKILDQGYNLTGSDCIGIDWDHFLTVLESHRISNTVYLDGRILPYIPATANTRLQEKYKASQFKMLGYMAELHRIISLFEQNAIPSIALKGPALGQAYYASPTQRESKDLDILVKPSDFQKAFDLLIEEGYVVYGPIWGSPKQQEVYMKNFNHCGLYHPTRHTQVELHWKLFSSKTVHSDTMKTMWSNLHYQKVGTLHVPVLSARDTFIYLCIHGGGYAHQWKRLFWVQDIACIIKKEGMQFVEDCYTLSIQQDAERYLLEACFLAHLIFKVELPDRIHAAIKKDQQIVRLSQISINAISTASRSDLSQVPSWPSFRSGTLTFQRIYLLRGLRAPLTVLKRIFVYLEGWQIYAFTDRLFFLNYFIAPFLRFYVGFIKTKPL